MWKGVKLDLRLGNIGMSGEKWLEVPIQLIEFDQLIHTQDGVYFDGVAHGTSTSGDSYMHVIKYKGEYYLQDGHHRLVRHLINGVNRTYVRVLEINE